MAPGQGMANLKPAVPTHTVSPVSDFESWLRNYQPGQCVRYATGVLWLDQRKPRRFAKAIAVVAQGALAGAFVQKLL